MSKSELKRLCTLNLMEMADRLHELETQLAAKTKDADNWREEALRIAQLNAMNVGQHKMLIEACWIIANEDSRFRDWDAFRELLPPLK